MIASDSRHREELGAMRGYEHGPGGFEHFEWLGPLVMIVLVATIAVGVVLLIRALGSRHTPAGALVHGAGAVGVAQPVQSSAQATVRPTGALTILEERFARGEIDREEFHQRRNDLLSQAATYFQPGVAVAPSAAAGTAREMTDPADPSGQ